MTDFNHFEDFRLAHEGKTPIIVGWVDLYPEDQVEVEEYLGEKVTRETHRSNVYIAWRVLSHRDFMREAYVEWVEPQKAPFYIENETEGCLEFNEKGYQVYKEVLQKLESIREILS